MGTLILSYAVVFTACFSLQVVYGQGAELEIINFEEDRAINLTIRFNQSVTEVQNDDYYVIEVRTRLSDGGAEYEGRVVRWNNTCTVTYQKSVRCVTKMGPVELYRKLNQSHVETEWTWTWKDTKSGKLKTNQWKKKLSNYFNSDITLMDFVTTEMIFATSTANLFSVAFLMGCVVVVMGAAIFLANPLMKWKKDNWRVNNQQLQDLFPENYEEGIIFKTFTGTYNQLRRRWTKRVSIHSESDSEETHKETLPKNEPGEPEIQESPKMSSNGNDKVLDEAQVKPEKMDCTEITTKLLDPAIQEDEHGDPVVKGSERVSSNTDESETSQSKQVSLEGDSRENCEEALARLEPEGSGFERTQNMSSKNKDEDMADTQCGKDPVKEEDRPELEDLFADIMQRTEMSDTSLQHSSEKSRQEFRFLLLGKTGVGKSSTGNTILGSELFHTSPGFSSETTECQTHGGNVGKWKVEITDSPGLFDTRLTEDNIAIKIVQTVACLHPGPSAFLFVLRITRFTPEEEATYRRLKAIFDEDVTKHIVIVFTGGDCLLERGTNIGKMLEAAPTGLREILKACGERYVVFDNTATDKNSQATLLLKIVEKMVEENNSPQYVCPRYMQISTQIENEIQKRLMVAHQREDEHKLYIKQLRNLNLLLLEKAKKTETEFKKRDKEREQHLKEMKESMENKMKELEEKLHQKILSGEDMEKEMKKLVTENEQLQNELKEMREKEQQQIEQIVGKVNEDIVKLIDEMINKRLKLDYRTRTNFRNRSARNKEEGFLRGLITDEFSDIIAGVWKVICSIKLDHDLEPVKELND